MYLTTLIKESIRSPQATLDKYLADDAQGAALRALGRYAYFRLPFLCTVALAVKGCLFRLSFLFMRTGSYDIISVAKDIGYMLGGTILGAALSLGVNAVTIWGKYFVGTSLLKMRLGWLDAPLSNDSMNALWIYNTFGFVHILYQVTLSSCIGSIASNLCRRSDSFGWAVTHFFRIYYGSFLLLGFFSGAYFLWLRYKTVKHVSGASGYRVAGVFLLLSPSFWRTLTWTLTVLAAMVATIVFITISIFR